MSERLLVVNADDFGQSRGINRGITEAHERGIVTSASLMVRWPAAVEAAAYARRRPELGLGLHVDLGEWVYREGAWRPLYTVVSLNDATAIRGEIDQQIQCFRQLMDRDPTHLDSHQHVHRREPTRSVLAAVSHELGLPLHSENDRIHYVGSFYGQTAEGEPWPDGISVAALLRILEALRPGFTEISCHPGYADDVHTMYREERAREVATLCDPRLPESLTRLGIQLTSFTSFVDEAS